MDIRWHEIMFSALCESQILIDDGAASGVEYVQDGEKRVATLAEGGEVSERICRKGEIITIATLHMLSQRPIVVDSVVAPTAQSSGLAGPSGCRRPFFLPSLRTKSRPQHRSQCHRRLGANLARTIYFSMYCLIPLSNFPQSTVVPRLIARSFWLVGL